MRNRKRLFPVCLMLLSLAAYARLAVVVADGPDPSLGSWVGSLHDGADSQPCRFRCPRCCYRRDEMAGV